MKSLKFIVLSLSAALFMTACGGGSTPEKVVEGFYSALKAYDYDKAKSFCTEASAPAIDAMKKQMEQIPEEYKKIAEEAAKTTTYEYGVPSISEDKQSATVNVKINMNGQTFDAPVTLKMENGSWKVDYGVAAPAQEEPVQPEPAQDSTVQDSTQVQQ